MGLCPLLDGGRWAGHAPWVGAKGGPLRTSDLGSQEAAGQNTVTRCGSTLGFDAVAVADFSTFEVME